MASVAEHAFRLDRLDDELRVAAALTPDLFARIIAEACTRVPVLKKAVPSARLNRLVEAGAWTDATFALIRLEMPSWAVRRVIHEDGEWLCSLSRLPNLPIALDETAEASHEILPLAILRAFVEARRMSADAPQGFSAVPQIRPAQAELICCDNFA